MKKVVYFAILVFIIIISIIIVKISDKNSKDLQNYTFNQYFEKYYDKDIYGADVLTIINKAIDNNKKYNIEKNDEGLYIENDKNSLMVELIFLSLNEEGQVEEKTTRMEILENAGLERFISNFGLTTFKCIKIEYNNENKVKKVIIKQIEI